MATRYSKVRDALVETIVGESDLSPAQAAERAEVDLALARQFWRALGLPKVPEDTSAFTERDAAILKAATEVLGREDADLDVLLQIVRASGQSLSRMAAVQIVPIAQQVLTAMRSDELSDAEAIDRIVGDTDALLTLAEPFVSYAWRRHLIAAVLQLAASGATDVADEQALAVGFADLVGFTAASQSLSNREIAKTIERFERTAYRQISEHGGSVVKMIGDEVMFTAIDAAAAAEIALALLKACASDDILPSIRIGLAYGPTLLWEGDVYGPTVNFASRLVSVAHPDSVLISEQLAAHLSEQEQFDIRPTPKVKLKGIGVARPRVLRRAP